ncbi:MAG: molybdopterin-dependent oxidoreductase [Oscillospiraceae bacterium]|nr:molybdopterin-dependent oxidoreductase [Oscillospiraceae bacterium]
MADINYGHGKIPGTESGIQVKHTFCDICTPGMHCGLDVLVKDGKIVRVEGTDGFPLGDGKLCTKGRGNRQYVYRDDRILTPLKRVGERGEGKFEPISWDEAIDTISEKLLEIKGKYGAGKVAFYSGYGKYYRFMLRRLASSFGTQSYGTESSACFTSGVMAWQVASGLVMGMNMPNSQLLIGWGANGFHSRYPMVRNEIKNKDRGMKIMIVDPRITPATQRLADLHLRPHLGTDGALALSIANVLIEKDWIDKEYIEKYVHGFEEYKEYVKDFTPEKGEELTGVPARDILAAAELIHSCKGITIPESSTLGHHRNGMQNYRAIMSLLIITGNVDVKGGQVPAEHSFLERSCGFSTHEEEFMEEMYPEDAPKAVGSDRFPLWYYLRKDMQACALADNILAGGDDAIRALVAFGMNYRMFTEDKKYLEAFKKLDFYADIDLFMTDSAKYADIVLPACTSLERGQFMDYMGQKVWYTEPAIEPVGQSKPDTEIITMLANRMELDDPLLRGGYDECLRYILRDLPLTLEQMKGHEAPVKLQGIEPYRIGSTLEKGFPTPTGKLELYSEIIASHPEWGLDPLPTYTAPYNPDPKTYPFRLCAGARIPNALHSRLHDVAWERSLLPEPSVEMSMEDADRLGIELGDDVEIVTNIGALTFKAIPTATVMEGDVFIYHGYREKDINSILDGSNLDPYSGFPAYRSAYCNIRRV